MNAVEILERKGVKTTSNRILVLNTLLRQHSPMSLLDLEVKLETLDKSSIFRVLTLFLNNEIVHAIEDGSGSMKYEVCHSNHDSNDNDMHVHFHCERCGSTFCFESTPIPQVELPEGFTASYINYVVKGTCPNCKV